MTQLDEKNHQTDLSQSVRFLFPPHTPIAEEFKMKNTDNMCTYGAFAAFLPDTLFSYSHKNVKISY